MIEPLIPRAVDFTEYTYGEAGFVHPITQDEIVAKINEIIQQLNKSEGGQ